MPMHIIDPVIFAEGLLRSCNGNVGKAITLINKTQESLLKEIQRTKIERDRRQLWQAHDDYQDAKHILMDLVGDHKRIAQILLPTAREQDFIFTLQEIFALGGKISCNDRGEIEATTPEKPKPQKIEDLTILDRIIEILQDHRD